MKKLSSEGQGSDSEIDSLVSSYKGWKGDALTKLRSAILLADQEIREDIKWKKPSNPAGIPVWYKDGIICFANVLKNAVRLTFPKGASIDVPDGTFNERLNSKTVRAIDFYEDSTIDQEAVISVVRGAIEINSLKLRK